MPRQGSFRDTLLDTLAVLRPSRAVALEAGVQALGTGGGQLIAVLGDMPAGAGAGARGGAARHRAGGRADPRGQRARRTDARAGRSPGPGGGSRSCLTPRGCRWRGRSCTGAAPAAAPGSADGRSGQPRPTGGQRPAAAPRTAAWRGRRRMASHRRTAGRGVPRSSSRPCRCTPSSPGGVWFWAGLRRRPSSWRSAGTATRLRRLPVAVMPGRAAWSRCCSTSTSPSPTPGRCATCCRPPPRSRRSAHTAGQGFSEASKYAPPVPELRGMVLLAAGGIGIAALLTDLIAVRLGSAALAGLPLLLLFTEPFTLSVGARLRRHHARVLRRRRRVPGAAVERGQGPHPRVGARRTRPPTTRRTRGPLAAAGRRVGFASVAARALPAAVHPRAAHHPAVRRAAGNRRHGRRRAARAGRSGSPTRTCSCRRSCRHRGCRTVLTYTTTDPTPGYLQIYALDKLTDSGWQLFGQPESLVPVSPRLPAAPGLTETVTGWPASHQRSPSPAASARRRSTRCPCPTRRRRSRRRGPCSADRSTLMVFDSGVSLGGLNYTVTSLAETPPAEQPLDAAPPPAAVHRGALPVGPRLLRPAARPWRSRVVRPGGREDPVRGGASRCRTGWRTGRSSTR